ncbi:hypothetical protein [Azorhizobium doebereinerae]|nr:hypothetical protein [Azorhizobium doebereinerae]
MPAPRHPIQAGAARLREVRLQAAAFMLGMAGLLFLLVAFGAIAALARLG